MKNENQKNYILIKEIILFQVYIFFLLWSKQENH